ncbi:MAG: DUF3142 domain-containing protein [Bryobacteraceae bacterium]
MLNIGVHRPSSAASFLILVLITSLLLTGCVALSSQPASVPWTTGFWFWEGSSIDPSYSGQALDIVYVQVGTIEKQTEWRVYSSLPQELPPAREYWLVYRYTNQGVPDSQAASRLAADITRRQAAARDGHLNVAGVQLDIDSPTSALPRYADFIRDVRRGLPKEMQVSITALLDWFRDGTAIDEVIAQVDEFVPQFYDLGRPEPRRQAAIAARIDAPHWAPVFNRFRKRFRIGISAFGRTQVVPNAEPTPSPGRRLVFYGDLRPLDVATSAAFELKSSRNEADETVLSYRATRKLQFGYQRLDAGDIVQFIIPTPDTIRSAVRSARQIKGYMAGVVFFRWPSSREDWAMQPDEVLDAATLGAPPAHKENRVQAVPGDCAAVNCVDLYLDSAGPLSPQPARYRIRASTPLEYFLPEQNMPVKLSGSSDLELSLPPYCGRGHLYIGRAVSLHRAEFTVQVDQ